jgi:hypothetical protein
MHSSLSPSPSRSSAPAPQSAKKPTSSHAKVPPRKRAVADVQWSDAAADTLPELEHHQPAQAEAALASGEVSAAAEQPAKTLASIVDIDAFLARVHRRN